MQLKPIKQFFSDGPHQVKGSPHCYLTPLLCPRAKQLCRTGMCTFTLAIWAQQEPHITQSKTATAACMYGVGFFRKGGTDTNLNKELSTFFLEDFLYGQQKFSR